MFAPNTVRLAAISGAAVATLGATSTATACDGYVCTCDGGGVYVGYRSGGYERCGVHYPRSRCHTGCGYARAYGGACVTYDYAPVRQRRVVYVHDRPWPRHYYRVAHYDHRPHRRYVVRDGYRPYRRHTLQYRSRPTQRHHGLEAGIRMGSRPHRRHYGLNAGVRIGSRPQQRHHGQRGGFRMRHRR